MIYLHFPSSHGQDRLSYIYEAQRWHFGRSVGSLEAHYWELNAPPQFWALIQNTNSFLPGCPSTFWHRRTQWMTQTVKGGQEWGLWMLHVCRRSGWYSVPRTKQEGMFQRSISSTLQKRPFQKHSVAGKAGYSCPVPSWAKDLRVAAPLNSGKRNWERLSSNST